VLQIINEELSQLLALAAGLYAFRSLSLFARGLFAQLLVWMLFYVASYMLTSYQEAHEQTTNNQLLFNIHMPLEAALLSFAAWRFFSPGLSRRLVVVSYVFFLVIYALLLRVKGWQVFNHLGSVAEALLITALYAALLFRMLRIRSWRASPELWACLGLLVFFACNVPYFSMFDYLNTYRPTLSLRLFNLINDDLANVRYLSLAFSFWMARRLARSKEPEYELG
jgi:hypothetical protein